MIMTNEIITGDLDEIQARQLTDEINRDLSNLWDRIIQAWNGRVWLALGYGSWDTWCEAEIKTGHLRIPGEERCEVVGTLRAAGLSTRAIGSATGLSKGTVGRALKEGAPSGAPQNVTGTDGKAYPSAGSARPRQRVKSPAERDAETADKIRLLEAQALYHRLVARGLRATSGEPIFGRLFHKISQVMPVETGVHPEMFISMVEGIARNGGLWRPVVVHPEDGSVIDGRLRLIACELANVKPNFSDLSEKYAERGDEGVFDFWVSENFRRQHITTQLEMKEINQKWAQKGLAGQIPFPWVERDTE